MAVAMKLQAAGPPFTPRTRSVEATSRVGGMHQKRRIAAPMIQGSAGRSQGSTVWREPIARFLHQPSMIPARERYIRVSMSSSACARKRRPPAPTMRWASARSSVTSWRTAWWPPTASYASRRNSMNWPLAMTSRGLRVRLTRRKSR